jgi:hypothetical protein
MDNQRNGSKNARETDFNVFYREKRGEIESQKKAR